MQETTFPVQIILHDDASTDGTQKIIQHYHAKHPKIITTILQPKNILGSGLVCDLHPIFTQASLGNYVAYCEGDDFWTVTNKLQTQVDIMESDPGISLSYHQVTIDRGLNKAQNEELFPDHIYSTPQTEDLLTLNFIPTCSVLVRSTAHHHDLSQTSVPIPFGDWPRWIIASLLGKVVGLPVSMACYRQHSGGVWSSALPSDRRWKLHQFWWAMLEILPARLKPKIFQNILSVIAKAVRSKDPQFIFEKRVIHLFRLGIIISKTNPLLLKAWSNEFTKALLGPTLSRILLSVLRIL
jgi:glycosyltransferase involved in cell wall biosynthesis